MKNKEKTFCAGLIGQVASPLAETEPRLTVRDLRAAFEVGFGGGISCDCPDEKQWDCMEEMFRIFLKQRLGSGNQVVEPLL